MCAADCVFPRNRYQVRVRPESREGKEPDVGFDLSLYPKHLVQARGGEQSLCLITVCGINNMNNFSFSSPLKVFFSPSYFNLLWFY